MTEPRAAFGADPVAYEGRPSYPTEVFELLAARCGLGSGSTVLEVGPGSGQATYELCRRGMSVVAVELSEALAAVVRDRTADFDVNVVVGAFEDVELPGNHFDGVVSAQAFHWINPDIGYRKAAAAMRPGGWLALWWTIFDDPAEPDPATEVLVSVLSAHSSASGKMLAAPAEYCRDVDSRSREITSGGFNKPACVHVHWVLTQSPRDLRRLAATYSPLLALDSVERTHLLDQIEIRSAESLGTAFTRRLTTVVYLADR